MKNTIEVPSDFPLPTNKTIWVLEEKVHERKTKAGLIIPESVATGAPEEGAKGIGVVYAVGPLVDIKIPCFIETLPKSNKVSTEESYRNIAIGDRVMFNIYATKGVSHDGYFYIMLHESDIYSVIPDEDYIIMRKERIDRRRAAVAKKESEIAGKGSSETLAK